jgi:hypothetical protein
LGGVVVGGVVVGGVVVGGVVVGGVVVGGVVVGGVVGVVGGVVPTRRRRLLCAADIRCPILLIVELDAMAPVGLRCGSRQGTTR